MSAPRRRLVVVIAALVGLWTGAGWAQALQVVGFNVESEGTHPDVVDDAIAAAQDVDLWGFSEVQDTIWTTLLAQAAAQGETGAFTPILGTTVGGDWLPFVYHRDHFALIRQFEVTNSKIGGDVRALLVAYLRLKHAGPEFPFVVNHLYRSHAAGRHKQTRLLNAWARRHILPVIAVGDDNFDADVTNGDTAHDPGYDLLTVDGVFAWVRPPQLIRTQRSFDGVLDSVFVAGAAQRWRPSAESLGTEESYCPSHQSRSDRRPVLALFELGPDGQPSARQHLWAQIQRLEV